MPTDNEQKELTDDDFYAKYHPEYNQILLEKCKPGEKGEDMCSYNGCMYETFGPDIDHVLRVNKINPKRVWTIIDNNSGWTGICAGYRIVDRQGFLITDEEWQVENECYTVFDETDELQLFHNFTMEDFNEVFKRNLPTDIDRDEFESDNENIIDELHDEWYEMEYEEKHRILEWWREKKEYMQNGQLFALPELKYRVKAFWGEDMVTRIEQMDEQQQREYPEQPEVIIYKFETQAELDAFMRGVQACFSWQKYHIIEF